MRAGAHPDQLGLIPAFMSEHDPRPLAEQIAENYCGGWDSFKGFTFDHGTGTLKYPGDPDMYPLASSIMRSEIVYIYPSAWVCVVQKGGAFDVARID